MEHEPGDLVIICPLGLAQFCIGLVEGRIAHGDEMLDQYIVRITYGYNVDMDAGDRVTVYRQWCETYFAQEVF